MTPTPKLAARVAFWIVFLTVAGVAARQIWVRLDPLRNHPALAPWWLRHNYAKLSSTHAPTAVAAYVELERCFLSKWPAYDWVVWRVKENIWEKTDPPIHFRLQRSGYRFTPHAAAPGPECRTVTEALMAMLHQEPGWRVPLQGDWRKWWDANWTSLPNRQLTGKPSGPENPRGARK